MTGKAKMSNRSGLERWRSVVVTGRTMCKRGTIELRSALPITGNAAILEKPCRERVTTPVFVIVRSAPGRSSWRFPATLC